MKKGDTQHPRQSLIEALKEIGSATASGELKRLGIRNPFIQGPVAMTPGASIVGPALTLQFMPLREDLYPTSEYVEPEGQLHPHVRYPAHPGDVWGVGRCGGMTTAVFCAMSRAV